MPLTPPEPTLCLVVPPPQLYSATFQLALIADALEANDVAAARESLHSVDLQACRQLWQDCGDQWTLRHRKAAHVGRTPAKRGGVSPTMRLAMGNRDGWRCRYCALPVACNGFFTCLEVRLIEDAVPVNDLWRIFGQSPDHVVPLAAGGANTLQNLISACAVCNYAKSACSIEELGLDDPRIREPILDGWTGLADRQWSSIIKRAVPVMPQQDGEART